MLKKHLLFVLCTIMILSFSFLQAAQANLEKIESEDNSSLVSIMCFLPNPGSETHWGKWIEVCSYCLFNLKSDTLIKHICTIWKKNEIISFSLFSDKPDQFEKIMCYYDSTKIRTGPDIYTENGYCEAMHNLAIRKLNLLNLYSSEKKKKIILSNWKSNEIQNIYNYTQEARKISDNERLSLFQKERLLINLLQEKHLDGTFHIKKNAPNPLLLHVLQKYERLPSST